MPQPESELEHDVFSLQKERELSNPTPMVRGQVSSKDPTRGVRGGRLVALHESSFVCTAST